MGRIPDEEIHRLKRDVSLEQLVQTRGIALMKTGANLVGLCPFHDDREPSLVITPESNLWHCLGACQAGGSVIDFVMRAEGVSFRHAVELLRRDAVPARAGGGLPPKRTTLCKLEPLASETAEDAALMSRVVDHYEATLLESAEGRQYLEGRGLAGEEVIRHFKLGLANRTLGYQLPHSTTKAGQALRGRLAELGVMRTTGHEHLSGCLVVPLSDAEGRVVQLYGRRLERDKLNTRHLYLPGSHRGVFNHAGLAGVREVILCEALIDALTFWCAGYRAVTSGYGVEGVTEEVLDAIATAGAELVQIAFDRDEAGDRGAEKVAERLAERGIGSARVEFPKGMDANAYAQKVGPATQSLGLVLRQAKPMRSGAPARAVTQTPSSPSAAPFPSLAASLAPSSELPAPESAPPVALTPTPAPTAERPSLPSLRVERHGEDVFFSFGGRKWRARSAGKPSATELKLNLVVADEREGGPFFVDSLDLYSARHRGNYLKAAAAELGADEAELRRELAEILQQLERERPTRSAEATTAQGATMSEADRAEALELLCDPKLCERIVEDLGRAGIVGEETNKLISYIAATSRKLEEPLAVVIQSSSAAGKSSLMEAVLGLMPEEERVQYSAMTGQSLFYMSGQTLKHKILAIVEEEGAERASYALKLLQSEGELTMASTGKDPATGRLITQTYRVEGPVMILLTTTSPDVDEELLNRCLVLSVDERRGQTRAIHERQRAAQTLEGMLLREDRQQVRRLHKNAQRLLEPVMVVNPYAQQLEFVDHATRARRDHMKYLTLIRAVTLLHQHQRERKSTVHRGERLEYIEATRQDVELATRLAQAVLPKSLDDLPPQTRRLLDLVTELVHERMARDGAPQSEVRFTRRELREWTCWGQTQLRLHLERLEEHEYLIGHRLGRGAGGRQAHYELLEEAPGSRRSSVVEGGSSGVHRGVIGPSSGGHRGAPIVTPSEKKAGETHLGLNGQKFTPREPTSSAS